MQEDQILDIQVLEQRSVKLETLKKGTIFRVVTAGKDGKGQTTGEWQVALQNPAQEDGSLKFSADKITFLMGIPKEFQIGVEKEILTSTPANTQSRDTAATIEGASLQ